MGIQDSAFKNIDEAIIELLDKAKGVTDPVQRARLEFTRTLMPPLMDAMAQVAERTDTATAVMSFVWLAELWASLAVPNTKRGSEEKALGIVAAQAVERITFVARLAATQQRPDWMAR